MMKTAKHSQTYTAVSGHVMIAVTNHENRDGQIVWDYWNARHSDKCPCLTSTDF